MWIKLPPQLAIGEDGVTLKLKKCRFFSHSVYYLGHIISLGQLEIDQNHTKSLKDAKQPTNWSALQSFLGLCNLYRCFIQYLTCIAHQLNKSLRKGAPKNFELHEEQLKSFNTFIEKICSPSVLPLPFANVSNSVDTDASPYGIGCTMFQTLEDGPQKQSDIGQDHWTISNGTIPL